MISRIHKSFIKYKSKIATILNGPKFNKNKKFLVVGHPRCGTGYVSWLLNKHGYKVGHEIIKKHGISSWTFATENDNCCNLWLPDYYHYTRSDFTFKNIIHVVRDPKFAIESILFTEDIHPESFNFRDKHINVDSKYTHLEKSIYSYINWNYLIESKHVDVRINLEDANNQLINYFVSKNIKFKNEFIDKRLKINSRNHDSLSNLEWSKVRFELKKELNIISEKYGYEKIFKY